MVIQVNLQKRKRRELAKVVGTVLSAEVTYKGPPTYAYKVGEAEIGRDGSVTLETKKGKEESIQTHLLRALYEDGFEPALVSEEAVSDRKPPDDMEDMPVDSALVEEEPNALQEETEPIAQFSDTFIIRVPLEGFDAVSLQNLRALIDSKSTLIRKSMGIRDLTIRVTDATIDFPWFSGDLSPKEIEAYTHFIAALCDRAKRQKRVISVERPTDNEKFTFRLFLVRLGLIGDAYAIPATSYFVT